MRKTLSNLLQNGRLGRLGARHETAPPEPATGFVAIGDIHGRDDLLTDLIDRLSKTDRDRIWVFLGDYVDRGPHPARVLERLQRLQSERPDQVVCLMGNHERMMLDFLDDPLERGAHWLNYGGPETMADFGLATETLPSEPEALFDLSDRFRARLPDGLTEWLQALPLFWQSGNVCCVHAAMNPQAPVDNQQEQHLLRGHPRFFKKRRKDNVWVVHGHTIVPTPQAQNQRIAIDTGAHKTGHLSAVRVENGQYHFLDISAST